MANYKLTVELPESVFQQLTRIANLTHQSLETLVKQSIVSNLPPSPDHAPVQMQEELLQLQTMSVEELVKVANSVVPESQQKLHEELLEKNSSDMISSSERKELSNLRSTVDQLMLKKAYAWAILRWRGYRLPALEKLTQ